MKSQFADKFFIGTVIVLFVSVSLVSSIEYGRPSIFFIPLCVSSNVNVPCIPLGGGDCSSSTGAIFCATPKPAPSNGGDNRLVCPDGRIVTVATGCPPNSSAPNVINPLFPTSSSTGGGTTCDIGQHWDNTQLACVSNVSTIPSGGGTTSNNVQYKQCYDSSVVPVSSVCPQPPPSSVSPTGVTTIPTKICYDQSVVTADSQCPPIPVVQNNSTTNNVQYVQCQNGAVVQVGQSCPAVGASNSQNGNGGTTNFPILDSKTVLIILIAIIASAVIIALWKSRHK